MIPALCLALFFASPLYGIFNYDRYVAKAQKGDWNTAKQGLTSLMVDQPDNVDLIYDAAVAAYKIGDNDKAGAYFEKVAQHPAASDSLKEQACFNRANAHVKKEQLEKAIDWYDETLRINPHNERAKHNKEIVKKMLQQKKKKEQQKDKNKQQQKKDDKQDQNDQQKNDQQKNDNNSEDQKNKQDKQQGNDQEQEDKPENRDQDDNEQQNKDDNADKQDQGQERNKKPQPEKEGQESKQEQARRKEQKESAQAKAEEQKKEAEKQAGDKFAQANPLDPALMKFLDRQEKKDAQVNKQLIKSMIGTKGGKRDDDHNW